MNARWRAPPYSSCCITSKRCQAQEHAPWSHVALWDRTGECLCKPSGGPLPPHLTPLWVVQAFAPRQGGCPGILLRMLKDWRPFSLLLVSPYGLLGIVSLKFRGQAYLSRGNLVRLPLPVLGARGGRLLKAPPLYSLLPGKLIKKSI